MSVYLGDRGSLQICRTGEPNAFVLGIEDVNQTASRMSVEFGGPSPFITGDQVQVKRIDGTGNLQLLAGLDERDFTRYIHSDSAGGLRFYDTYADALTGGLTNALALVTPTETQEISIDVANISFNCIAQLRNWEITTTRETVDITLLGEEFRSNYDQGLISGQGALSAIWDYKYATCDPLFEDTNLELAHYFSQLVIRFKEGAKFKGIFFIFASDTTAIWYEADCIVSNVAMSFAPGQVVDSSVQFVTTGVVQLKQGIPPGYILQEDSGLLELETPPGALELETDLD